jgi:signal transduction histidine kinase
MLVVTVPVVGLGGGTGNVHVGFSLRGLAEERAHTSRTVGQATLAVCLVGLCATWMLASWLVRPIRRLTVMARRISRGELPPQLPAPRGSDEVAQMAEALRVMLAQLNEANQQLLVASRHAGMAEIATGVLHNVGNVLNSVNVSVELMHERTRDQPISRLQRLEELLGQIASGPPDAARLTAAVRYVGLMRGAFESSREASLGELAALRGHLDHVKQVVAMQNAYARRGGVVESIALDRLLRDAVELGAAGERQAGLAVTLDAPDTVVLIDRHRVLQILVNLISNARDALATTRDPRLAVTATLVERVLRVEVKDSGVGIPPETLARLFSAGFTTKPNGHGYGLHSAANAARQLGGELAAASPGPGQGAVFTLTVPVTSAGASDAG